MVDKNILDNLTSQEIKELINRNEITLEQLDASTLRELMNYETDMLCIGEGDVDLICKCSDLLDKIEPNPMTSEEFINIIQRTKEEECVTIVDDTPTHNPIPKREFILKRIAIIAAAILILMTATVGIASAFGFDICKYISEIVRKPEGTESNIDGITFYHNGETEKYGSIEEMIKNKDLSIMYPTKWPEGISLNNIRMSTLPNGNNTVQIVTNDISVNITIELGVTDYNSNNPNVYQYDGIAYFMGQSELFFAYCYHENNYYYFTANTKEDLVFIIENMKE